MRVQVYIATTEWPVEIQKLTEEPDGVPCCVSIGLATTESQAISSDYHRFVARGTGVVAKLTGHDSYRLCLSRRIDGGESWQLGAYLSHWLKSQGRLFESLDEAADATPDLVVWASGDVDYDLNVTTADDLRRKLEASADLFQDLTTRGIALRIVVPAGAATGDIRALLDDVINANPNPKSQVVVVERLDAPGSIFGFADLDSPGRTQSKGMKIGSLIILTIAAVAIASLWSTNSSPPTSANPISHLDLAAEMRVEHLVDGRSCFTMSDNRRPFRRTSRSLTKPAEGRLLLEAGPTACRIALALQNQSAEPFSATVFPAGRLSRQDGLPEVITIDPDMSKTANVLDRTIPNGMKKIESDAITFVILPAASEILVKMLQDAMEMDDRENGLASLAQAVRDSGGVMIHATARIVPGNG